MSGSAVLDHPINVCENTTASGDKEFWLEVGGEKVGHSIFMHRSATPALALRRLLTDNTTL